MKLGLENRTQLKEASVGKKRSIVLTSKHHTLLSRRK